MNNTYSMITVFMAFFSLAAVSQVSDDTLVKVLLLRADDEGLTRVLKTPVVDSPPEWAQNFSILGSIWQSMYESNYATWFPDWYLIDDTFGTPQEEREIGHMMRLKLLNLNSMTNLRRNRGTVQLAVAQVDDSLLTAGARETVKIGRNLITITRDFHGKELYFVIGKGEYGDPVAHTLITYRNALIDTEHLGAFGIWVQEWNLGELKAHCEKYEHVIVHGGGIIQ